MKSFKMYYLKWIWTLLDFAINDLPMYDWKRNDMNNTNMISE